MALTALAFLRTLWLFTESDVPTFVIPNVCFGLFGALSGRFHQIPADTGPGIIDARIVLARLPLAIAFNWANLLVFDLANQRHPASVAEDRCNKPWRPIPTGRISCTQTRRLLLGVMAAVIILGAVLGVANETAVLYALTWAYNDLAGGDDHWLLRNAIIAAAFGVYNAASLRLLLPPTGVVGRATLCATPLRGAAIVAPPNINATGFAWVTAVSAIIMSTMHFQDLKDVVGDRARGRRTAPIALGDGSARWSLAVPIALWSFACPWLLSLSAPVYILPVTIGLHAAQRVLRFRERTQDRRSWHLWCLWLVVIYALPFLGRFRMNSACWNSVRTSIL